MRKRVRLEEDRSPRRRLTLTAGQWVLCEYNESVASATLAGDKVLVRYAPGLREHIVGRYYAHLRDDGVLEIIPGNVLRPTGFPANRKEVAGADELLQKMAESLRRQGYGTRERCASRAADLLRRIAGNNFTFPVAAEDVDD